MASMSIAIILQYLLIFVLLTVRFKIIREEIILFVLTILDLRVLKSLFRKKTFIVFSLYVCMSLVKDLGLFDVKGFS